AAALKEYIRVRYMLPEQIFSVKSVAEDWDGLKARIESGDFAQKDRILSIIDSNDAPDTKESRLKGLGAYSQLLRDVFPELRRVEYQVDYAVRSYSNAEARSLVNTNPSNLSQLELYRLAESYGKESAEYKRIMMEIIPKYYENDATALSNAAALLLENGEVNSALRLLEKVRTFPQSWNNLGVAYMLQGDLDKAEELLKQAQVSGNKEATHNLNEIAKIKEDEAKRKR
ncbi:tetratricopeptide repeat protein, partial [Bacteroides sp. 224]|uniref:tetratricopeptide repeat protein n=1 Tax=Bacteroides sp. 224 TaxID=2302936 RepID=UPI0013D161D3